MTIRSASISMTAFAVFWAFAPVAEAGPKKSGRLALMKPVKLLDVIDSGVGATVKASFPLACGETFRGVLLRERALEPSSDAGAAKTSSNLGKILEVAAIVDRGETFCSSLPNETSFSIPVKAGSMVRSVGISEPRRVTLDEALDVGASRGGFSVGWQNSCRPVEGILLRPLVSKDSPKIEISMVLGAKDDQEAGAKINCPRDVRRVSLTSINLSVESLRLAERPGKIQASYVLRIVAPDSLAVSEQGELSVSWQQNCRETPLGLLFTGKTGREVAIVTAFIPSLACSNVRTHSGTYALPGLLASTRGGIKPIKAKDLAMLAKSVDLNYQILPAASVDSVRRGQGDKLTVTAKGLQCNRALGVMAGVDTWGNTALGVVVGSRQSVCQASSANMNQRRDAPLVLPETGPIPKVFGLRVFGSILN
jgi:hypothetical protein